MVRSILARVVNTLESALLRLIRRVAPSAAKSGLDIERDS
jgi:hypothetical protein